MGISYVQSGSSGYAYTNTRQVALSSVGAGNLIVAVAMWEGADTTVAVSDGTSSFTAGSSGVNPSTVDGYYDIRQSVLYLLGANGGNKTYTLTLGASRDVVNLHILEFSKTEGDWALDGQATYGYGKGTSLSSGTLTTTGTSVVCVGWARSWTNSTYSNQQIGGSAASEAQDPGDFNGGSWYRVTTLSAGNTTASAAGNDEWLCGLIAFSADGASPSGIPMPLLCHYLLGD